MNKPISFGTIEGCGNHTDSLQIAAAAVAIGIPFYKDKFITTAQGDGIKEIRAIFNFSGASIEGNTIAMLSTVWNDKKWIKNNPNTEVVKIKKAFQAMFDLADQAKGGRHIFPVVKEKDTIYTASTAAAATMIAIGHNCLGVTKFSGSQFMHFNRAAASDLALWNDKDIHLKLPEHIISYIKCALLNWKILVEAINTKPEFMAVKHNGRTAFVGKNDSKETQLKLEKLLYRK